MVEGPWAGTHLYGSVRLSSVPVRDSVCVGPRQQGLLWGGLRGLWSRAGPARWEQSRAEWWSWAQGDPVAEWVAGCWCEGSSVSGHLSGLGGQLSGAAPLCCCPCWDKARQDHGGEASWA